MWGFGGSRWGCSNTASVIGMILIFFTDDSPKSINFNFNKHILINYELRANIYDPGVCSVSEPSRIARNHSAPRANSCV
jgi:hypothetical protein